MSTGQIVGGVIGGLVGAAVGSPFLGAQVGMTLGGLVDPPKGPTITGPRVADLTVQTSAYGTSIPRIYGVCIVKGNIFWIENNQIKETMTKKKSGGKGGSKTTTKTYSYSATFAVGLCEGPIVGVLRIWVGPNLIYDVSSTDQPTIIASYEAQEGFRLYTGTEDQLPDPRMQATVGVEDTPAFRGLAYIVFDDFALEKYGNSLAGAQVKVEVLKSGAYRTYVATRYDMPTNQQYAFTAYGNGIFVRIAHFTTSVWTSPDAEVAWTRHENVFTGGPFWQGLVFGNGWFVANSWDVGYPTWRSQDGEHWFDITVPFGYYENGSGPLAFGNGAFVLAANDGHVWRTINEGETWTRHALPYNHQYQHILFNGAIFLIWMAQHGVCMTSPDGAVWTDCGVIGGLPLSQHSLGATKGLTFMLFSVDGSGTIPAKITEDGLIWTDVAVPPYCRGITADTWNWICLGNDGFATSETGEEWTDYPDTIEAAFPWETGCWNGAIVSVANSAHKNAYIIQPKIGAGADTTVGAIVSEECQKSGILTLDDIDTTALVQPVHGYRVSSRGSLRSAIEPLQTAWPFDAIQHGYKIRFRARGTSTVVSIADGDLGARSAGDAPITKVTNSREMDTQLPRRVAVQYLDLDREQERNEQYAERINSPATNIVTLELPISLTAGEAAAIADKLLYLAWLERYKLEFVIPAIYNNLEPADVVDVPTDEGIIQARLTAIEYTVDGKLSCKASYEQQAVYTPSEAIVADTGGGTGGGAPATTTILPVSESIYQLLDIPTILSSQPTYSFGAAMCGTNSGWDGGVLLQSKDAGGTWANLVEFVAPASVIGICNNSIGAVEPRVIDSTSILNITLRSGELFSVTELAMLNGANHFAYGADGRWEIIAAKTCTLLSGKSYNLQDMLRGRFGTEWAMGTHTAVDAIVLLDTNDIETILSDSGSINIPYLYRGITLNKDIDTDTNRSFIYKGVNLKPLSPVYVSGSGSLVTNDWTITWIRRTRIGGEWRDGVDVDLGESQEKYEVDIFTNSSYTTVKRTLTVYSQSATYTSAQQVADFGSNQTNLYIKVYQISSIVGRGYATSQSLTLSGGDPYFANVVLLMPMTGTNGGTTWTDYKGHTITRNGDTVTSTARSIGTLGSSTLFDGTTDFLNISGPNSDFNFGTGDFCIETWVYIAANSAVNGSSDKAAMVFSADYSGTGYVEFMLNGNGASTGDGLTVWNGTTGQTQSCTISQGAWHHIAVARQSGVATFYVDGTVVGTKSWAVQYGNDSAAVKIGGRILSSWNNCLNGNLGPLRVTKGVARYTSNFTPVQGMYPTY